MKFHVDIIAEEDDAIDNNTGQDSLEALTKFDDSNITNEM